MQYEKDGVKYFAIKSDSGYEAVSSDGDGGVKPVDGIEAKEKKVDVDKALLVYAKENGLEPTIVKAIKTGERKIQQGSFEYTDSRRLTDSERVKSCEEMIGMQDELAQLEEQYKAEKDGLKRDYEEACAKKDAEIAALRRKVEYGIEDVPCNVSWERDVENGMMFMLRHDTLTILDVRPMREGETQISTEDVPQEAPQPDQTDVPVEEGEDKE